MQYAVGSNEKSAGGKKQDEKLCMIVVMGVTGAGKSYFINRLAGREVTKEGTSLHACTFAIHTEV
jgi:predicted GTPase